jgi:hypothetical protein
VGRPLPRRRLRSRWRRGALTRTLATKDEDHDQDIVAAFAAGLRDGASAGDDTRLR